MLSQMAFLRREVQGHIIQDSSDTEEEDIKENRSNLEEDTKEQSDEEKIDFDLEPMSKDWEKSNNESEEHSNHYPVMVHLNEDHNRSTSARIPTDDETVVSESEIEDFDYDLQPERINWDESEHVHQEYGEGRRTPIKRLQTESSDEDVEERKRRKSNEAVQGRNSEREQEPKVQQDPQSNQISVFAETLL
jgi:hypothetical protein